MQSLTGRGCVKIAIGFVNDQGQPMCAGEVPERGERFCRVFGARRVVWRDKDYGLGALGQQRGRMLCIGDHPGATGQGDHLDPGHVEPHGVVEIVRDGHQHRITGARDGRHDGSEGLIAARGDRNLLWRNRSAVVAAPAGGQRAAQVWQAQHRAIEMAAGIVFDHARHGCA